MGAGQGQQMTVAHLGSVQQTRGVDPLRLHQADVVGPEHMAGVGRAASPSATARRTACPGSWGSERGQQCQHTVFGQRAGGPSLVAVRTEALVGGVMLNVGRVEPRDQHVHIEQEGRQDTASRNSFTSSSVTAAVPARTGSKGTPFRALRPVVVGLSACRERVEMTSPRLLFCREAKPLATTSTSSLIVSVVRISMRRCCRIKHQTSTQAGVLWLRSAQVAGAPPTDRERESAPRPSNSDDLCRA